MKKLLFALLFLPLLAVAQYRPGSSSGGGSGTVTSVTSANTDASVATTTTTPVITINTGTTANKLLKLDGSARIPALNGSLLTNLPATGSNTYLQYNSSGSLSADAGLTWTVGSLLLGSAGVGSGNSSAFNIASGDASAANNSGNITIKTGTAANTSGDLDIDAGIGSNVSGAITIGGDASSIYLGSTVGTIGVLTVGSNLIVSAGGAAITGGVNTDSYKLNSTGGLNTVLKGNGTSFVQSTETYAVPGQVGTALTSDGTNWTAAKTGWLVASVGSNFTTTGQSLVDITGLSFSASANSTYEIEAWLDCTTSAVATGVEFGVNTTGSAPTQTILYFGALTSTTASSSFTNANNTAEAIAFMTTSSQAGFVRISGYVKSNGAGTISIRGLKVISGTLTVLAGSKLLYRLQ